MQLYPRRAVYCRVPLVPLSAAQLRLAALSNTPPRPLSAAQCAARTVAVLALFALWFAAFCFAAS
jgi:hypothetical protein